MSHETLSRLLATFTLLLGAACLTSLPINAEEPRFPGLAALMTDEEFDRTGLSSLSPVQRAELNRWLAERARFNLQRAPAEQASEPDAQAATNPAQPPVVAKRLKRTKAPKPAPIQTRIVGKFSGWSGKTLFALENGEFWRQRQAGRYFYRAESPEVELYQNRLGFWELKLLATGKTVKVSRVSRR